MAADERKGFPMMATAHWWSLRRKFRSAIPKEVTANYLASALGMNENSARTNILPSLRVAGIVDKDGRPTDLAVRWRDDGQYPGVCDSIRTSVYPQELLDLAPDATVPRAVVQTWFANHTGLGESGAQKMTSFYMMLLEKDPAKQTDSPSSAAPSQARPNKANRESVRARVTKVPSIAPPPQPTVPASGRPGPDLHINVQVHIAADATATQIDAIFASMAKHLKDLS